MPPCDDAYLPLKTLVVYSGLSIRTLRGYLAHATHPLPCFRIGGKVLVRRSDYDTWAAQFRVTTSTADLDDLVNNMMQGLG